MFYAKKCQLAIACAATCSQRAIGVDGLLGVTSAARQRSSSTILSVNRLQELTSLQNTYFALRHGQSEANVEKIIASNPVIACHQYGLSSLGRQQAQQASQDIVDYYLLRNNDVASFSGICLLSSDLLRAKQTAEAVALAVKNHNNGDAAIPILFHNDQVITEIRLRERGFGEWDLSEDSNYEEVWKDDAVDPSHTRRGVESVDSVMDRVTECILDWDARLENYMVVCVAHGDVLQILQTSFSKLDGSKHRTLQHLETATLRKLQLTASL